VLLAFAFKTGLILLRLHGENLLLFLLSPDVARANIMKLPSSPPGVHTSGSCWVDMPIQRKDEYYISFLYWLCLHNSEISFYNKRNNEISVATIFTWAYQFTIYSYVQMFHFNEYHLNKISIPSNTQSTRLENSISNKRTLLSHV
jgi:hypothetical protein